MIKKHRIFTTVILFTLLLTGSSCKKETPPDPPSEPPRAAAPVSETPPDPSEAPRAAAPVSEAPSDPPSEAPRAAVPVTVSSEKDEARLEKEAELRVLEENYFLPKYEMSPSVKLSLEQLTEQAKRLTRERIGLKNTAKELGIRWPPAASEIDQDEIDEAYDDYLQEKAAEKYPSLDEDAFLQALEKEMPAYKEGDRVKLRLQRKGTGTAIDGRLRQVNGNRAIIGIRAVRLRDLTEEDAARLFPLWREQYFERKMKKESIRIENLRHTFIEEIRDEEYEAFCRSSGLAEYNGNWYTDQAMKRIVQQATAAKRREVYPEVKAEVFTKNGFVKFEGEWMTEEAARNLVAERKLVVEKVRKKKAILRNQKKSISQTRRYGPISLNDFSRSIVIVDKKDSPHNSVGTGFVLEMNGREYLVTNQHVFVAGAVEELSYRTLEGVDLRPVSFEFSKERDIVRMEFDYDVSSGEVAPLSLTAELPEVGGRIVIWGNEDGRRSATGSRGRIVALGPDIVEFDARISPGNSGSPIITRKGKVAGIATYSWTFTTTEETVEDGKFDTKSVKVKERFFGYRFDNTQFVEASYFDYMEQCRLLRDLRSYLFEIYQVDNAIWQNNIVALRMYPFSDTSYCDESLPERMHARIRQKNGLLDLTDRMRLHAIVLAQEVDKLNWSVRQLRYHLNSYVSLRKHCQSVLGKEAAYAGKTLLRKRDSWATNYLEAEAEELLEQYKDFYNYLKASHLQLEECRKTFSQLM